MFDALIAGPDDGEVVLLLHGFPQSSAIWRPQLEALAAAGYRAIAFDQRGYSPGARPDDVKQYGINRLVGDALAVGGERGAGRREPLDPRGGAGDAHPTAARAPRRSRLSETE